MPRADGSDTLQKQTQSLLEGMLPPSKPQIIPMNTVLMKTAYYFKNYNTHERQSHITKSQEKQLNSRLKPEETSDIGIIRHGT